MGQLGNHGWGKPGAGVGQGPGPGPAPAQAPPPNETQPSSGDSQIADILQGQDALSQGASQYQSGLLENQFNNAGASSALQGDLVRHSQQSDLASLGLSQDQLNIQRGALNRQSGMLNEQHGMIDQLFNIDQSALKRQGALSTHLWNIDQGAIRRAQGNWNEEKDIFQKMFGLQMGELQQGRRMALQGEQSDATSRGALQTVGYGTHVADTNQQYNRAESRAQLSHKGQWIQMEERRHQLEDQFAKMGLGYGEQQKGLADSIAKLGISHRQENLSYKEQQAQIADRGKNLDISSRALGLSKDDINFRAQNALNQLGIQGEVTKDQYLQGQADLIQGRASDEANFTSQVNSVLQALPQGG